MIPPLLSGSADHCRILSIGVGLVLLHRNVRVFPPLLSGSADHCMAACIGVGLVLLHNSVSVFLLGA